MKRRARAGWWWRFDCEYWLVSWLNRWHPLTSTQSKKLEILIRILEYGIPNDSNLFIINDRRSGPWRERLYRRDLKVRSAAILSISNSGQRDKNRAFPWRIFFSNNDERSLKFRARSQYFYSPDSPIQILFCIIAAVATNLKRTFICSVDYKSSGCKMWWYW